MVRFYRTRRGFIKTPFLAFDLLSATAFGTAEAGAAPAPHAAPLTGRRDIIALCGYSGGRGLTAAGRLAPAAAANY